VADRTRVSAVCKYMRSRAKTACGDSELSQFPYARVVRFF
jgi:hypothetical protein